MPPLTGTFIHDLGHNWLGKTDIAVQTVLLALGFIAVGLRLWSRRLQRISLQGNDWLIVAATIFMTGRYSIELLLILLCGMGLHAAEVARVGGPAVFVQFDKLAYAGHLLSITTVALIQLSMLHYYIRRFPRRLILWPSFITMGLCTTCWIASSFATAFICTPPQKIWFPGRKGHCGNRNILHTGTLLAETILCGIILLLPIPGMRKTIYSKARKIALAWIYLLATGIIIISAVRVKVGFDRDAEEQTYHSARDSLLSSLVPLLGIITSCLPLLTPAAQQILGPTAFLPTADGIPTSPRSPRYWKPGILPGAQMDGPEVPLVAVTMPPMAKRLGELAHGQIKITSHWEIHSARNSVRLERDSIHRGSCK